MARHYPANHQMRDDIQDQVSDVGRDDELEKLGITRTHVETFTFGPYRYTNLDDALAQANRAHDANVRDDAPPRSQPRRT